MGLVILVLPEVVVCEFILNRSSESDSWGGFNLSLFSIVLSLLVRGLGVVESTLFMVIVGTVMGAPVVVGVSESMWDTVGFRKVFRKLLQMCWVRGLFNTKCFAAGLVCWAKGFPNTLGTVSLLVILGD